MNGSILNGMFGGQEVGLSFEETLLMCLCSTIWLEVRGEGGSRCGHGSGVILRRDERGSHSF
jgi:hypothetical protein